MRTHLHSGRSRGVPDKMHVAVLLVFKFIQVKIGLIELLHVAR